MRGYRLKLVAPAIAAFALALGATTDAVAQQGSQACAKLGYKPGSNGYYRCLQALQDGAGGGLGQLAPGKKSGTGKSQRTLKGKPDNALVDYTGGPIEGATNPDPELLKQFRSKDLSPTSPLDDKR